jgi:hypothetical protein
MTSGEDLIEALFGGAGTLSWPEVLVSLAAACAVRHRTLPRSRGHARCSRPSAGAPHGRRPGASQRSGARRWPGCLQPRMSAALFRTAFQRPSRSSATTRPGPQQAVSAWQPIETLPHPIRRADRVQPTSSAWPAPRQGRSARYGQRGGGRSPDSGVGHPRRQKHTPPPRPALTRPAGWAPKESSNSVRPTARSIWWQT